MPSTPTPAEAGALEEREDRKLIVDLVIAGSDEGYERGMGKDDAEQVRRTEALRAVAQERFASLRVALAAAEERAERAERERDEALAMLAEIAEVEPWVTLIKVPECYFCAISPGVEHERECLWRRARDLNAATPTEEPR